MTCNESYADKKTYADQVKAGPASSHYRGTSFMRKRTPLGPYRSPMTRDLW